ncbi:MAG: DUF4332 domain-containing protein [Pirellulaceae bacterium]
MLRNLLKLIKSPDQIDPAADQTKSTQIERVGKINEPSHTSLEPPMIAGKIGEDGIVEVTNSPVPAANHRAWLLSKNLTHIKICSPSRCEMLAKYGIVTAGDLAKVDAEQLVQQMHAPESAVLSLTRYRAAIRLAASVPGMMPRDAQILIRIHRHSVRAIALDSPSALYQDIYRFAYSTKGQRFVRGRRLPSLRKIKAWVHSCRDQNNGEQPLQAAA